MRIERQLEKKFVWLFFIGLSLLATISKIFVGFDIDEGYALALPYRLLQGERLLTDMWEVHQTSSIFAAAILKPFLCIFKSTEGIVLYSRVICTVLHLVISILGYRTFRLFISKTEARLLALVYYNFLPKWMMNVDFSMQFVWFFMLCILCFLMAEYSRMNQKHPNIYIWMFLAGISLALLVLGYPTMASLYPVYVVCIVLRKSWEKKQKGKSVLAFTLGCAILALLFVGYLLSYMSISQLFENIPYVFSDGSHQFSGSAKWSLWLGHIKDVVVQTVITGVPALVVTCILYSIVSKRDESLKIFKSETSWKDTFIIVFTNVYICLTSAIVVFADLLGIAWGPFRLQIRYIIIFVLGFFILRRVHDQNKARWVLQFVMIASFVAFLSILLASNVGPTSSSSYLVFGVMAVIWILLDILKTSDSVETMENKQGKGKQQEKQEKKKSGMFVYLTYGTLILFLLSILFCKGYYVRVTAYPPSDICMERQQLNKGAAKGIYVYPAEYNEITETYDLIKQYSDKDDQVLYLGTQALSNLYTDGKFVTPTTISTPAFNEQWIEYFEMHPEKMPTVIFLSKSTVDNQDKFFAQNAFGKWLAEHYDAENRIDGEFLCVIKGY